MEHAQHAASRPLTHMTPPRQGAASWKTNLPRTQSHGHTSLANAVASSCSTQLPRCAASSPLAATRQGQPPSHSSASQHRMQALPGALHRPSADVPTVAHRVVLRSLPGSRQPARAVGHSARASAAASSSLEAYIAGSPVDGASVNGRAPGTGHIDEVAQAKARLAQALATVDRGVLADEEQRGIIEEAQVDLEALGGASAGLMADGGLDLLHGLWRLRYSNTSDVLSILRLPNLGPLPFPILQVGDIYQNFICKGEHDSGVVQNIVDWSVPGFLEEKQGARFVVTADFSVRSGSSLLLAFREAGVDSVRLSELAQGLLAPAVLPRTQFSMEALQFIKDFQFSVSLQDSSSPRRAAGGRYLLTYLDDNTLIGRANAPSGSFIFERVQ